MTRDYETEYLSQVLGKHFRGILLSITRLTEQRSEIGSSFSAPSLGTSPILLVDCMRPRWQIASPLRHGPCSPSLQSGLSLPMLLGEVADRPLTVRPGRGQPNPTVPISTGEPLVFSREAAFCEVKGWHVSLYLCC